QWLGPVESLREPGQFAPPPPVLPLEVEKRFEMAAGRARQGSAAGHASVRVDDCRRRKIDDLAAGVANADAPVDVVGAVEDARIKRARRPRELRTEDLARTEHVRDGPRVRVVDVLHQVAPDEAAVVKEAIERRPTQEWKNERREAPARKLERSVLVLESRAEQAPPGMGVERADERGKGTLGQLRVR